MANYIKETKGRFGERVIIEYDEYAGTIVKKIYYKKSFFPLIDGTIDYIEEYDKETGQILRQIYYKKSFFPRSEATINYILEYDKDTDVAVKKIFYQSDGKTINVIYEGHKYTGFTVKETKYRTNGTIEYINEYDIDTKKLVKKTGYLFDGKTIHVIIEHDKVIGSPVKMTKYLSDGKTIIYEFELFRFFIQLLILKLLFKTKKLIDNFISFQTKEILFSFKKSV